MATLHRSWMSFGGHLNAAFISLGTHLSREVSMPASRHANLAFIVTCLLGFLQIKFQGNAFKSPFQTHPITCYFAITNLLIYGLAWFGEQRFSELHLSNCANMARRGMAWSGSLLRASLASILFPGWVQPILYLVSILFYAEEELIDWLQRRVERELQEMDISPV